MKNQNISRNLEQDNIYLNRFWSGVCTNRSPLFVPLSQMGLQVIQRLDTLWDGLNTEISPAMTLVRRYGYSRYCSQAFGGLDYPLAYYSFRNLSGTVYPLVDTPTHVYQFGTSSLTSVFAKSTTVQTSFQKVANYVYACDGTTAWKWNGTTQSLMGIASPVSAPILSYVPNGQLSPSVGYSYVTTYSNPTTGHVSTGSPVSANTGPIVNQTAIEGSVTTAVISTSFDGSNNVTVHCSNNFQPGQKVVCSGLTFATWLNGKTLTINSVGSGFFIATGVTHGSYALTNDTGSAMMTLTVPNSPYEYTVFNSAAFVSDGGVVYATSSLPLTKVASSPTIGQYAVNTATGQYTFAAADLGAGIQITYTFSLSSSTAINIQLQGIGSTDPQVTTIQIYRTLDGGSVYYLDATISNTSNWTYTDSTLDANLNTDIIAPLSDSNDPPPSGMSLLAWYAGRLWGASGSTLYFSGGPDTTNGVGTESWPPANNFPVPGQITGIASTSQGLVVCTTDNAYVVYGQNTASFTVPQLWQHNFGVATQNCIAQDGDNLFFLTMRSQLFSFSGSLTELGNPIEANIGAISPSAAYITLHRSGTDEGLFVGDGLTNIWRFSMNMTCWSPVAQPVGGVGAIGSIEVTPGTWQLMAGRSSGGGYLLNRSTSTYTDDGQAYDAFAIVGSLILAPPRRVAVMESVLLDVAVAGTYPTVSVLLNEISGTFTVLPKPVADPPQLVDSKTVWMKRHDLKAAQTPLPQHVRHLQVKIDFGKDEVRNELLGLCIV